jgi:hypothetical protein
MKKFPSLELIFAGDGGQPILADASFRLNEASAASRKLVLDPPRGKFFRAACILMLLAKYRGEDFADAEGLIWFSDKSDRLTWIKTLGVSFGKGVQQDFFQKYFQSCNFLSASRGSGHNKGNKEEGKGRLPSAKYRAGQLLLQNLNFYKAGQNSTGNKPTLLKGDDLARFAAQLENYEAGKSDGWQPIVPEIIADTKKDRPRKPETKAGKKIWERMDEQESVLQATHWRILNEEVRKEIQGGPLGGDWYVVSVVPNWVGDWKPVLCEAVTNHKAGVKLVYQAPDAANNCPAIRVQLRINSSGVDAKNHDGVINNIQTRIQSLKTEMGYWVTETRNASPRKGAVKGSFEFFESYLNHPFMAIMAVPPVSKKTAPPGSAAPPGTWCVVGVYPLYRRSDGKCCSAYLNGESPVLNFYYHTILDLFERGPKDGYLKATNLLKKKT